MPRLDFSRVERVAEKERGRELFWYLVVLSHTEDGDDWEAVPCGHVMLTTQSFFPHRIDVACLHNKLLRFAGKQVTPICLTMFEFG